MPRIFCLAGLVTVVGCAGSPNAGVVPGRMVPTMIGAKAVSTQTIASTVSFQLPADNASIDQQLPAPVDVSEAGLVEAIPTLLDVPPTPELAAELDLSASQSGVLALNLPTALAMVDRRHPAVGLAQWRVQQAYAQLDQAKVLWLPSIRAGFSFNRHDGNLQASDGQIVDVNRNSFQYGLGAGAVGAGTSTVPGLVAQFHMADAIFQPKIARSNAAASTYSATAETNAQLMRAAIAYFDLLNAHQELRIVEETRESTSDLVKLTSDFASAGKGLQADADRMETELALADNRMATTRERIEVDAARLIQAINADANALVVPMDPSIVPIDLVTVDQDRSSLIQIGLSSRPELCESQALVAAACQQHKRQKFAPFVPSVLLGFSTGGFGGGLGNNLDNVDGRYDFDALVTWELRNLGLGERAARRDANARVQQAKYAKLAVMDQVAREVSEAHAQVTHRGQRITITQRAIELAENSYQRNLSRIRDGQGLPLEALQSLQALEEARRAYMDAVVAYNQAQFRLQWSLGWPVDAANM